MVYGVEEKQPFYRKIVQVHVTAVPLKRAELKSRETAGLTMAEKLLPTDLIKTQPVSRSLVSRVT